MRALLATAALLFGSPLSAATLGGKLAYPGEGLPAMIVVARDAAGATFSIETRAGQARYRLEVPAGSYVLFAIPLGNPPQPGQVPLRGAHTEYSVCGRDKAKMLAGACRTGPLVEVRVSADEQREDVDVDDWYLPDALMATLDLAPFALYPADPAMMPPTRSPDFAAAPALPAPARAGIQRAAARGPFFAARFAVATWGCGPDCMRWALVDMGSGRIRLAEGDLRRKFPCDAEPLEFREESRLLRVHRSDGERVLTQDFVWTDAGLEKKGESVRPAAQFCRR